MFGGSAWQKDPTTGEYYLHSFLKQQPDLNWRNPAVKRAVFDEMRYWLDMGVAGFRLDVANFYFKDARFRNNPFGIGPTPRPYDLQRHLYDRDRPELHELFREIRQLFDSYDAMTVGEIFAERPSGPLSASYLGAGDELHLAFDFSLMYAKWSAPTFQRLLASYHDACHPESWPCTVLSNHDQPRAASRFGRSHREEVARLLMVLLLTMRGTPFLYYGEELGMQNLRLRRHQIVDPVGKRYWPFHPGRDGARTPMQWDASLHAGFSTATPWLPVHPDYPAVNVRKMQQQPGSLLHLVRELITLRRNRADLREGPLVLHPSHGNVLCYERGKTRIALNFASTPATIASRPGDSLLLSTHRIAGKQMQNQIRLSGFEAVILGAV